MLARPRRGADPGTGATHYQEAPAPAAVPALRSGRSLPLLRPVGAARPAGPALRRARRGGDPRRGDPGGPEPDGRAPTAASGMPPSALAGPAAAALPELVGDAVAGQAKTRRWWAASWTATPALRWTATPAPWTPASSPPRSGVEPRSTARGPGHPLPAHRRLLDTSPTSASTCPPSCRPVPATTWHGAQAIHPRWSAQGLGGNRTRPAPDTWPPHQGATHRQPARPRPIELLTHPPPTPAPTQANLTTPGRRPAHPPSQYGRTTGANFNETTRFGVNFSETAVG